MPPSRIRSSFHSAPSPSVYAHFLRERERGHLGHRRSAKRAWADGRREPFGVAAVSERLYKDLTWDSKFGRFGIFGGGLAKPDDVAETGGIFNLEFNTDGSLLAAACEKRSVVLLDPLTQRLTASVENAHTDCVNCVRFLDTRTFATCSDDATVALWDARYLKQKIRSLVGHTNWVKNVEYSRREEYLATSGFDGAVYLWDINRHSEDEARYRRRIFNTSGLMRMRLSAHGDRMVVSTMNGFVIVIHDVNLDCMEADLKDFKPNMYRLMQISRQPLPIAVPFNSLFRAKRNRVEFISDFPDGDDAEIISSLQLHPQGWVAVSRNVSADEESEWCCVHDVHGALGQDDEDAEEGGLYGDEAAAARERGERPPGSSSFTGPGLYRLAEFLYSRQHGLHQDDEDDSDDDMPEDANVDNDDDSSDDDEEEDGDNSIPPLVEERILHGARNRSLGESSSSGSSGGEGSSTNGGGGSDDSPGPSAPPSVTVRVVRDPATGRQTVNIRSEALDADGSNANLMELLSSRIAAPPPRREEEDERVRQQQRPEMIVLSPPGRSAAAAAAEGGEPSFVFVRSHQPRKRKTPANTRTTTTTTGNKIYRNRKRLTHYIRESNSGRGFIKEVSFSHDGRILCSPYEQGFRLLSFDPHCQDLDRCFRDGPQEATELHEVERVEDCHRDSVLSSCFSPAGGFILVTGCRGGKIVWHQPRP